jgi:predicted small lipoprotein YifL
MSKFVVSALLLVALGGCGQKGQLYEETAPVTNQTTSPDTRDNEESQ